MPLEAVAVALRQPVDVIASCLTRLIDNSVVVSADNVYSVSPPVRDAIFRVKGHLDQSFYRDALARLTSAFWKAHAAAPTIEVVDATLHAVARSGSIDFAPYQDLIRASTVHRLAQECYYRREWREALEYARRAKQMAPDRRELREVEFRALVQLERWEEAERGLREIEATGDKRRFYLAGFLLRRRRRYEEAIKAFASALAVGDRSLSVYRDYADSLYRVGRFPEAFTNIKSVLDRDSENIFALDLLIRICIDWNNLDEAERWLETLGRCDLDRRFIHHRRATLYAKRRMWDLALTESEAACTTGFALFESFAMRVDIFIEMVRYGDAMAALDELGKRFRGQRLDVQRGLRCKLLLREKHWREAKTIWDTLEEKNRPVHLGLLRGILLQKAQDPSVTLAERQSAEREAKAVTGTDVDLVAGEDADDIDEEPTSSTGIASSAT